MEISNFIFIFFVGLFAGFINVIVGSGSSITVPFLIFLGLPPVMAIGTNRFSMMFNNFTGAVRYHAKKYLNLKIAILFSIFAAVGSVVGAKLVLGAKPEILTQIVSAILFIEALVLIFSSKIGINKKVIEFTKKHYIAGCLFGLVVGVYGGFIGMAMTSILMFFIVVLFRFTFLESAAITKVITFVISLVATIVFLANFKVDIWVGIVLSIAYIIGGYFGVHSAIRMGDFRIKILFIIIASLSAIGLLLGWKI